MGRRLGNTFGSAFGKKLGKLARVSMVGFAVASTAGTGVAQAEGVETSPPTLNAGAVPDGSAAPAGASGDASFAGAAGVDPTRLIAVNATSQAAVAEVAIAQTHGTLPGDPVGRARGLVSQLQRSVGGIDRLAKYAAKRKEAYPSSCVARRRAMGEAIVRLGQEALSRTDESVQKSDAEEAKYQLFRLQAMVDKMKTVLAEANLCVIDDGSFVQISNRAVQIDRGIPDDDPAAVK